MKTIFLAVSSTFYTPASLLLKYAKNTPGCGYKYGPDGRIYLRIEDKFYEYDHWDIDPVDKDNDDVTVYLKEVEKGETK